MAHTQPHKHALREPRVEALRLVAAFAIALFHTCQPWFRELVGGYGYGDYIAHANPAATAALGFIDLLGAYGNHVFFAISGLFLVPAAARDLAASPQGYWPRQAKKTARRAASILGCALFWCLVALAISLFIAPIEGVDLTSIAWFTAWLEFIWVYLAFVVLTPLVAWAAKRLKRPEAVVVALTIVVFAVNAYIAFVSQGEGDRDLTDWRKLMSAVTYFVAFVCGAALAKVHMPRRAAGALLAATVLAALAVEGVLAAQGELALIEATSFKSTSLLSFAMALASLLFARRDGGETRVPAAAAKLASGILGFYILQSLTSPIWLPLFHSTTSQVWLAANSWRMLAAAAALSAALLGLFIAADVLVRAPLFRRLGLGK